MSIRATTSSSLLRSISAGPASRTLARQARAGAASSSLLASASRASPSVLATPRNAAQASAAPFSTSARRADEFENPFGINSLAKLTEEEEMLKEAGEWELQNDMTVLQGDPD